VQCDQPATLVRPSGLKSYVYPGRFLIRAAQTGSRQHLQVINHVHFEEYLRGVVPSESVPSWPMETLKAQAVAARTYSLFQLLVRRAGNSQAAYDVDDTVQDQVYLGLSTAQPSTDQAVVETAGEVLTWNGTVAKTYFYADSGGYTEDAQEVWGDPVPYCQAKPEVYDSSLTPDSAWTKQITLVDLSAQLRTAGLIPAGAIVRRIEVSKDSRNRSGRARFVNLTLATGAQTLVKGTQFRYALKLRSTLFDAVVNGTQAVFQGRGFGHGAGMSQLGAKVLADRLRWDYRSLLQFYYTDVRLAPMSAAR